MKKHEPLLLTIIAGTAATYFSICCVLWILFLSGEFFNDPSIKKQLPDHQYLIALPCFFLMAIFWFAVMQTIRKRASARFIVLCCIILASLICWYDLSHGRCQAIFYNKNGNQTVYLTWWFSELFK